MGAAALVAGAGFTASDQLVAISKEAEPLVNAYVPMLATWWAMSLECPDLGNHAEEMGAIHDRLCDVADQAEKLTATTMEAYCAKAILPEHALRVD